MRGDAAIWRACMEGRPDWYALAGATGRTPDGVRERAVELGAWWLIALDPKAIARGDRAARDGATPAAVADAMGSDVHAALIVMGLRKGYGERDDR